MLSFSAMAEYASSEWCLRGRGREREKEERVRGRHYSARHSITAVEHRSSHCRANSA